MPGYPSVSRIHSRSSSCDGEGYLNKASIGCFAIDLDYVRRSVARDGVPPEQGVETMRSQGSLSINQEKELRACLGRIANAECPSYPYVDCQAALRESNGLSDGVNSMNDFYRSGEFVVSPAEKPAGLQRILDEKAGPDSTYAYLRERAFLGEK